jgi:pimeloyl-ACP methyl ester carboxylesterase
VSSSAKPSIVFCHGIWADGSSFGKVIQRLQAAGYVAIAAQYALKTVDDDVATVKKALGRVGGPAILVGHSYGGQVITAAGNDDRVRGLVYIAALAPEEGETGQAQQDRFATDIFKKVAVADGSVWMLPDAVADFAGDLPVADRQLLWATQCPPDVNLFNQPLNAPAAWKKKPSWYIVCRNDRTVHPDNERFLAKRMGATTIEIDSSHVAMLSHPDVVFETIVKAANTLLQTA